MIFNAMIVAFEMRDIMRFLKDLKKYYRYTMFAARAQLKAEVANSYLNWLWWVLEPFCFMLIYSVVFGIIFKMAEDYFPIFIFSGNAMWIFFSSVLGKSVNLIKLNEVTISKVYIPKFILLLIEVLVSAYKMMLSFAIVAGMLVLFRVHVTWKIMILIPIFIVFIVFTFGLSTICMHLGVYIGDLSYIIGIGLNMLMYFTGVFYSIENRVPAPLGTLLTVCNPVAFLMSSMRKVVIYAEIPNCKIMLAWFTISIVINIFGIRCIYKNENSYMKVI